MSTSEWNRGIGRVVLLSWAVVLIACAAPNAGLHAELSPIAEPALRCPANQIAVVCADPDCYRVDAVGCQQVIRFNYGKKGWGVAGPPRPWTKPSTLAPARRLLPNPPGQTDKTFRLYPELALPPTAVARVRMCEGGSIAWMVKVRRVDEYVGPFGGVDGSYFNNRDDSNCVKLDLLPGEHSFEISNWGTRGTILKGNLEAYREYRIEPNAKISECSTLVESTGSLVTEACYDPTQTVLDCPGPRATLYFSLAESKETSAEGGMLVLQSIDGVYGPNKSWATELFFYNETSGIHRTIGDFSTELCPGTHQLVVAGTLPSFNVGRVTVVPRYVAPTAITHTFEAARRYTLQFDEEALRHARDQIARELEAREQKASSGPLPPPEWFSVPIHVVPRP